MTDMRQIPLAGLLMTDHRERYAIAVWQSSSEAGPASGLSLGVLLLAAEPMVP